MLNFTEQNVEYWNTPNLFVLRDCFSASEYKEIELIDKVHFLYQFIIKGRYYLQKREKHWGSFFQGYFTIWHLWSVSTFPPVEKGPKVASLVSIICNLNVVSSIFLLLFFIIPGLYSSPIIPRCKTKFFPFLGQTLLCLSPIIINQRNCPPNHLHNPSHPQKVGCADNWGLLRSWAPSRCSCWGRSHWITIVNWLVFTPLIHQHHLRQVQIPISLPHEQKEEGASLLVASTLILGYYWGFWWNQTKDVIFWRLFYILMFYSQDTDVPS